MRRNIGSPPALLHPRVGEAGGWMAPSSRAFARHDPRQARARLLIALGVGVTVAVRWCRTRLGDRAARGRGLGRGGADHGRAVVGADPARRCEADAPEGRRGRPRAARRLGDRDPGQRLQHVRDRGGAAGRAHVRGRGPPDVRRAVHRRGRHRLGADAHRVHAAVRAPLLPRRRRRRGRACRSPATRRPPTSISRTSRFTIGMCFQTSDVTVTSRQIRRAVMGHALLSFAYNTTILATAVSLIVGFFG